MCSATACDDANCVTVKDEECKSSHALLLAGSCGGTASAQMNDKIHCAWKFQVALSIAAAGGKVLPGLCVRQRHLRHVRQEDPRNQELQAEHDMTSRASAAAARTALPLSRAAGAAAGRHAFAWADAWQRICFVSLDSVFGCQTDLCSKGCLNLPEMKSAQRRQCQMTKHNTTQF